MILLHYLFQAAMQQNRHHSVNEFGSIIAIVFKTFSNEALFPSLTDTPDMLVLEQNNNVEGMSNCLLIHISLDKTL